MRTALIAAAALVGCGGGDMVEPGEGPPAQLLFGAPGTAVGFVGNVVAPHPVRVLDRKGRPLEGVGVSFRLEDGGQVAWPVAVSDRDGYASAGGWRLGPVPGVQRLVAETGALSASTGAQAVSPPPPGFKIEIHYLNENGLQSGDRLDIEQAIARWEELVMGDLADVPVPMSLPTACPTVAELRGRIVDDLLLLVRIGPLSGASATTTICARRRDTGLPAVAYIRLDPVKAALSEGVRQLMTHEIAHALGFGIIWSGALLTEDKVDPRFLGSTAEAAYRLAVGPAAVGVGVPVEATGGPAVARTHWRESVLGPELLTPLPNVALQPLSAITVSALRDLGYVVDDARSDPFSASLRR